MWKHLLFILGLVVGICGCACKILNPDSINANLTILIALVVLFGMTLSEQLSKLRNDIENLKEISQCIQSRLLNENAELLEQHLTDQQKILMQDAELKRLQLKNYQLEDAWKQLEDIVTQHSQNSIA